MRVRSKEEIQAILELWPDVFESQFGAPLNKDQLRTILKKELENKELELIKQRFFDFTPQDLRALIEELSGKVESETDELVREITKETKRRGRPKRD